MIFFVLLVYSEKYYEKALYELNELAKKTSGSSNYKLLVVNNNNQLDLSKFDYLRSKIDFIEGDNTGFEFSGWDVATAYLRTNYNITNSYIAYANDTFCHHRKWGFYQKYKFSHAFKYFIQSNISGLCGEKNIFSNKVNLNNVELDGWISTYLFMISTDFLINNNVKFDNATNKESCFFSVITENEIKFNSNFDEELAKHLNSWLFPSNEKNGWYKANDSSLIEKRNKLKSILNEKLLSANIKNKCGEIIDINSFLIPSMLRYLKKLLVGK